VGRNDDIAIGQKLEAELEDARLAVEAADAKIREAEAARSRAVDEFDRVLASVREHYETERMRLETNVRAAQDALQDVDRRLSSLTGTSTSHAQPSTVEAAQGERDSEGTSPDEGTESDWRQFLREQNLS
jgi:chromosome segregation ATPase